MKQLALTLFAALLCTACYAQDSGLTPEQMDAPKVKRQKIRLDRGPTIYITTSTGLNNNTGVIGFNFELPLSPKVTIDAGPGYGFWGHKVYVGAKYYLRAAQRGFAFGIGVTHASGEKSMRHLETSIYGNTTESTFRQNPQTNALFAAYKYWSLGKQYNRIYVQLGWSATLSGGDRITQLSGPRMSNNSIRGRGSVAPHGPVLAFGFSFGLH